MRSLVFIHLVATSIFVSPFAHAQSAIEKVKTDLANAKAELKTVQEANSGLRSALYREINVLDDEAISLGKTLRKLERDDELRGAKAQSLERILAARDAEVKFTNGILDNYINAMPSRLNAAERPKYVGEIEKIELASNAAGDDIKKRTTTELQAVEIGIERLLAVAGGQIFEGRGLRAGESLAGKFALVGPSAYFSSADGNFAGIAAFAEAGVDQPRIIDLTPEQTASIHAFVKSGDGGIPTDGTMGKAIVVQDSEETIMETVKKGGIVGYAILGLGVVSMALALFKLIEIYLFRVPGLRTINKILDDLLEGDHAEAKHKAACVTGLSGDLVKAGVEHFYGKRRILEETLFEKLLAIRPKLDRFLPFLSLTAAAAPLMGLLGTVLGIIKTFKQMAIYGTGNAKSFSAGISEALITTAEGLVVAIPVLIVHGMLRSLAKGKYNQAEAVAVALMNGTSEIDDSKPVASVAEDEEPDDEPLTANA